MLTTMGFPHLHANTMNEISDTSMLRGGWRAESPVVNDSPGLRSLVSEQELRFQLNRWESLERIYSDSAKKKLLAVIRSEGAFVWQEPLVGVPHRPIELKLSSKSITWKEKDWKLAKKLGFDCGLVANDSQDLKNKSCGILPSIQKCPILYENIVWDGDLLKLRPRSLGEEKCQINPSDTPKRVFVRIP
ncbi:MAG: hypothetical protein WCH11_06645 [Bdellovibrio sp.]